MRARSGAAIWIWMAMVGAVFAGGDEKAGDPAEGTRFWSFQTPVRPTVPEVGGGKGIENPVDGFVVQKLEKMGLQLKQQADRPTLIRRLYLDMLGLPPTPEEVEAFVRSVDPNACEALVERVLASPHYGERWGRHWLDAAGWAESSLIVDDAVRPGFWRYRNYVIDAFNKDKPFDQFVMEQVAGDEMVDWRDADVFSPEIVEKLVATGFLRSAPDGTDNQLITQTEKRFATQQTAMELATKALLGLTMNCVRCHDHKFDPFTQAEYYGLIAIFQPAYDPENWLPGNANRFGAGPVRAIPLLDRAGREAWRAHCREIYDEQAELTYQIDYGVENTYRDRYIGEHLDHFDERRVQALREALRRGERERTSEENALIFAAAKELGVNGAEKVRKHYPEMSKEINALRQRMQQRRNEFNESLPELIWALWDVSATPSPTPLLNRGEFTTPGHEVEPGVLSALDSKDTPWRGPVSVADEATTGRRLAFARWLTRPDHPLTARVMVNRIWQHHFGKGIVATPDDFGERGARPTHPELLDWLAVEFIENGWSIKHLHRLILLSSTYRQAGGSDGAPALLSGFPRRRLESEIIRDRMLAVSGLLDPERGDEPVPTVEHSAGTWIVDPSHPGRHRRSVYLTSQRSKQPALLKIFDGPVMETNWPERHATAVAPQALVLMNHPFVLECAAAFADRIADQSGKARDRLDFAWRTAFGRDPRADETGLILREGEGESTAEPDWEVVAHAILSSNEFLYLE